MRKTFPDDGDGGFSGIVEEICGNCSLLMKEGLNALGDRDQCFRDACFNGISCLVDALFLAGFKGFALGGFEFFF